MKTKFNPWPYGIVLIFVVFLSGMATVVVIASTHRDSLVSENYYEQELKFQNQIDGAARAEKAGAGFALNAADRQLRLSVPAAQVAEKFSGTIEFYRPSSSALDRQFPLAPHADGTQTFDISKLAAGRWQVRVRWTAGGLEYFLERKITL